MSWLVAADSQITRQTNADSLVSSVASIGLISSKAWRGVKASDSSKAFANSTAITSSCSTSKNLRNWGELDRFQSTYLEDLDGLFGHPGLTHFSASSANFSLTVVNASANQVDSLCNRQKLHVQLGTKRLKQSYTNFRGYITNTLENGRQSKLGEVNVLQNGYTNVPDISLALRISTYFCGSEESKRRYS